MAKSLSYAVSSQETNIIQMAFRPRGMILVQGDTAYDTDFAIFYTLYVYLNRRVHRVEV